jgi:hypothetical protein
VVLADLGHALQDPEFKLVCAVPARLLGAVARGSMVPGEPVDRLAPVG